MAVDSPYENARKQRIEENLKRMQELGIKDLSKVLTQNIEPIKSSLSRTVKSYKPRSIKEKVKVQLRRSTRNLNNPQPEYQEVEIDVRRRIRIDSNGATRHYSRQYERKYASDEERMNATTKAESIQEKLPSENPSFVKPMLQSHVSGGFWLGLPAGFCKEHLPRKDERIVLEDEDHSEWETVYLANKTGLSGGWRGFSLDHGLVDGDALVFELVQPLRFKIHIVRASEPPNKDQTSELDDGTKSPKLELNDSEHDSKFDAENSSVIENSSNGRKRQRDEYDSANENLCDDLSEDRKPLCKRVKDLKDYLKSVKPLDISIRNPKKAKLNSKPVIEGQNTPKMEVVC